MRFQCPPTSYKEATWRTVHHSPGFTVEDIAEHLGIAASTLYSMANRNMPNVVLPRKHIDPVVILTKTPYFAQYFSAIANGIFVPVPDVSLGIGDVLHEGAVAMDEAGHVFSAIGAALQNNGKVDRGLELEQIERHAAHVQVAMSRVVIVARREAEKQP